MAVEDVHIVEAHALQALVQACQQVFARTTPLSVGAGPHVVTGFAGDDQLIAVGPEVAAQVFAKVGFRAAVRRAVIVGQIKVVDAQVKRGAQHVALGLEGRGIAEVVPQTEGNGGQLKPAFAAVAVGDAAVVTVCCGVVHGWTLQGYLSRTTAMVAVSWGCDL